MCNFDNNIGTEELAHLEMVATIVHQLTRNLTMEEIEKHADWVDEWRNHYNITKENVNQILKDEIAKVFVKVLECAGVYKRTEEGQNAFRKFISTL